jgi:hypothetical protein
MAENGALGVSKFGSQTRTSPGQFFLPKPCRALTASLHPFGDDSSVLPVVIQALG